MRLPSLLLHIFLFHSVFFAVNAQTPSFTPTPPSVSKQRSNHNEKPIPSPSKTPYPFWYGRIFSVSTSAPIRSVVHHNPQFLAGQRHTQAFIEAVEDHVRSTLSQGVYNTSLSALMPCNSLGLSFKQPFKYYSEIRNLPIPDTSCLSQFTISDDTQSKSLGISLERLHEAARNRSKAVFLNRARIAKIVLGNWSDPDALYDDEYIESSMICKVNNIGAARIGTKWYLRTLITNRPAYEHVPLFERMILYEYLRIDASNPNDLDDSLRVPLTVRPPDGIDLDPHVVENRTTTILEAKSGSHSSTSSYRPMYYEIIPAVKASLELAEQSKQQVNDALLLSSVSILVLPLLLTLVPIAALTSIEHTSSKATFVYMMVTNVFTVIPLIIKGVELIVIGKQRHTAAAVRITAAIDGTLAPSSLAELWTAQCHMDSSAMRAGIVFVVVGIVFFLLGIALELLVKAYHVNQMRRAISEEDKYIDITTAEYNCDWKVGSDGPRTAESLSSLLSPTCDLLEKDDNCSQRAVHDHIVLENDADT